MSRSIDNQPFISFSPPCLGPEEIDEVVDTLRSPWITTGPKVKRFEEEFAALVGAPAALAVNSCTSALTLALDAIGVSAGDEVITTTLTFAATVNVIEHRGARPVIVDVEEDTLNIDPQRVEEAVTPKTKAIIPVHYAGHPADMDALVKIAQKHNLAIIEDAAHALPAKYRGETVGSSHRLTAFSFYATKNYTTCEGGMLTGDPEYIERARIMSLHGMSRDAWARYSEKGSWYYEVVAPGYKCNMTDLQAAIGLHQIRKVDAFQCRRKEVWDTYNAAFLSNPQLSTPVIRNDVEHALHLYVLRLTDAALSRDALIDGLKQAGIGTSVHFIPVHCHAYYREKYGFHASEFPVASTAFQQMLSLPLHAGLGDHEVERIVCSVSRITDVVQRRVA